MSIEPGIPFNRGWAHLFGASLVVLLGVTSCTPPPRTLPGPALSRAQSTPPPIRDGVSAPYPAPDFVGIDDWLNSKPLDLKALRGKVVLIDFWTYSCINCVRTLPYLTSWDKKYRDRGLVIIGVHTPEFKFEKDVSNIKKALAKYHIEYPIAVDSAGATWNAYKNEYWPAHYLINQEGQVVYTHFGEGDYDVTESNIRSLLGLSGQAPTEPNVEQAGGRKTAETYLGSDRADRRSLDSEAALPLDHWILGGKWKIEGQRITSEAAGATLKLHFTAKKVFLVMGSASDQPHAVTLKLNGSSLGKSGGSDVHDDTVNVAGHALYELIDQKASADGLLELSVQEPGVELYAFTFGG